MQTNKNKVNKICALLQTTGGKIKLHLEVITKFKSIKLPVNIIILLSLENLLPFWMSYTPNNI